MNSTRKTSITTEEQFDASKHQFTYKNFSVWQKSILFASSVMELTETLRSKRKNYRLFEQLESASTSIAMNIAEGKGRFSKKEFCHFLMIARGSLYETLTLLEILKMRSWISEMEYIQFENQASEIAVKINALNKSLS